MTLRVALVGGPMYDHLYEWFDPDEIEVVVHADHPTLNREVARMLAAGERIDVLSTHSKYAPSQADWLLPLDGLIDPGELAPLAVELCRFDDALLCAPRLIDVRIAWSRRDRVDPASIGSWTSLADSTTRFGFPGRDSGLFGTFFELVVGAGGRLFDTEGNATLTTPQAEAALATLHRMAERLPADLATWHYDHVDTALLNGTIDAAGVWPGGWGAISRSPLADRLQPTLYPAGPVRRVSYSGCHAWAIPRTCSDPLLAAAVVQQLSGRDAQRLDTTGGSVCAHVEAFASIEPVDDLDRQRLALTATTIEHAMITYPPHPRFPELEEAGWQLVQRSLADADGHRQGLSELQQLADRLFT